MIKALNLYKVKYQKAANQSKRKDKVRGIVLHHIMMGGFQKNVDFLASKESGVSSHYVLGRKGELTQLISTRKKSWHAGVSEFKIGGKVRSNLNNCTVGIEIVNPGVLTKKGGEFYYNCGGTTKKWTGTKPVKEEIVYPDGKVLTGYSVPYPEEQINKLVALCKGIIKLYPDITENDIVTHYQIALPFGRKSDPFGLDLDLVISKIFDE